MADWPEYKERMLVKMRDRGMTASEIAKAMGTTRNAIIGKMDRMGLLRRRPDRPTARPPDTRATIGGGVRAQAAALAAAPVQLAGMTAYYNEFVRRRLL